MDEIEIKLLFLSFLCEKKNRFQFQMKWFCVKSWREVNLLKISDFGRAFKQGFDPGLQGVAVRQAHWPALTRQLTRRAKTSGQVPISKIWCVLLCSVWWWWWLWKEFKFSALGDNEVRVSIVDPVFQRRLSGTSSVSLCFGERTQVLHCRNSTYHLY